MNLLWSQNNSDVSVPLFRSQHVQAKLAWLARLANGSSNGKSIALFFSWMCARRCRRIHTTALTCSPLHTPSYLFLPFICNTRTTIVYATRMPSISRERENVLPLYKLSIVNSLITFLFCIFFTNFYLFN